MNTYVRPTTKKIQPVSVFEWVDVNHSYLKETLQNFLAAPDKSLVSRCMYLAHQIQKACDSNTTGILAALQLNRTPNHKYTKELFAAVLCELMGKEMELPASARLYLCCAALTQDLGMFELQNEALDRQASPLNTEQRRRVEKHLDKSFNILKHAGVKEPLWLEAVLQHHERPDGKGYNQGLEGEEICIGARILHVADAYVALIRPRGDRPALSPKDAMRDIFLKRGNEFDERASRCLIHPLGMYPPGTWVQLANGEIGVVSEVNKRLPFQKVMVIIDRDGEHLEIPVERNTESSSNTIVDTVSAPFHMNLSSILNGIWPQIG